MLVLTPVIRPENIARSLPSIEAAREEWGPSLRWRIVPDLGYLEANGIPWQERLPGLPEWCEVQPVRLEPRPSPCWGEHVLNPVLDSLSATEYRGWLGFVADDSILPAGWGKAIRGEAEAGARAVMLPQEPRDKFPRGIPAHPRQLFPGAVDFAQIAVLAPAMLHLRFEECDVPDGRMAWRLYASIPAGDWAFLRAPAVPYNALRG